MHESSFLDAEDVLTVFEGRIKCTSKVVQKVEAVLVGV